MLGSSGYYIEKYDWRDLTILEKVAKEMAEVFKRERHGRRLKRLFSSLATCTSIYEAKSVLAFHYHRSRDERIKRFLEAWYKSLSKLNDAQFKEYVMPKLRLLFNYTMYYLMRG